MAFSGRTNLQGVLLVIFRNTRGEYDGRSSHTCRRFLLIEGTVCQTVRTFIAHDSSTLILTCSEIQWRSEMSRTGYREKTATAHYGPGEGRRLVSMQGGKVLIGTLRNYVYIE